MDSSGAGIPNATVTITELDTHETRSVVTDDRGTYRALALPVGHYVVKGEHAGFKTALRTGISLVVAQEAVADLSLQVGEATQQIEASAEASVVDVKRLEFSERLGFELCPRSQ